jgi:Cyclin M transmembrane N-terminal domain
MQLALIAGLVLVSAVFSGSEMALVSLRDGQLQRLAHASAGGRVLARDPNRYLATNQIGITLVVGERVPKRIARQHPEAWALATARPLSVLAAICWTASDTSPPNPVNTSPSAATPPTSPQSPVTPSLRSARTPSATTTRTPSNAAANSHRA